MSIKDIEAEVDKLIGFIAPLEESNKRRSQVTAFVRQILSDHIADASIIECGSSALKTYLPEGDLDLILFTKSSCALIANEEMSYLKQVFNALCDEVISRDEGSSSHADMTIRNVEFINARTKITHCIVNNIPLDITVNHLSALTTLVFLEEVNREIGFNNLFKRSVLLIKNWCSHESPLYCGLPILGAKSGMLSSYAISTLVIHIFNRYDVATVLSNPFQVLRCFLFTYMHFPWDCYVMTAVGGQPIVSGGSSGSANSSNQSNANINTVPCTNKFQHIVDKIQSVIKPTSAAASPPTAFPLRSCNIQDPVDPTNNLGISVSRMNLHCIERALQQGFGHLDSLVRAILSPSIAVQSNNPNMLMPAPTGNGKSRSNSMTKNNNNNNNMKNSYNSSNNYNNYHNGNSNGYVGPYRSTVMSPSVVDTEDNNSSNGHTSVSAVSSSESLPPPFPAINNSNNNSSSELSDAASVTSNGGSVAVNYVPTAYSAIGYPQFHYRVANNINNGNNVTVNGGRTVAGGPHNSSPSMSSYSNNNTGGHPIVPPIVLPHSSYISNGNPSSGPFIAPMTVFAPVTPSSSNGNNYRGQSPRVPSPPSALDTQQFLACFFPKTLAFYLIDGKQMNSIRADLMEHPLQMTYKARNGGDVASATVNTTAVSDTGVKDNNNRNEVFKSDLDMLWKQLKRFAAPKIIVTPPVVTPPKPVKSNPVMNEVKPNIVEVVVEEIKPKVEIVEDIKVITEKPTIVIEVEKSALKKIVSTETLKELVDQNVFDATSLVVDAAVVESVSAEPSRVPTPVTVASTPTPVKQSSQPTASSTAKKNKNNNSNTTSTSGGNGSSNSVTAPLKNNGNKHSTAVSTTTISKSSPTPSAAAVVPSVEVKVTSEPPSSGEVKRNNAKQSQHRILFGIAGFLAVCAVVQGMYHMYRVRVSSQDSRISTNFSDADAIVNQSLTLDDALNNSEIQAKKRKGGGGSVDSSGIGSGETLNVVNSAVTHWIELNDSITFGDFSKNGFPNYFGAAHHIDANVLNGSLSVSYQWTKDNVNITTARLSHYSIKSAKYSDGGYYRCFMYVTKVIGTSKVGTSASTATPSALSSAKKKPAAPVEVKVITATTTYLIAETIVYISKEPKVKDKPSFQSVKSGTDFYFSLSVEGNPPPSFQWFKNGYIAEGQTNQSIAFPNISYEHSGTYSCDVRNFAGGFVWADITISVRD